MTQAQQGNTVKVHYTGRLDDGSVFDSSAGGEPLEFTIGQGQMIPGFEQGVVGMELGESRTVIIAADQAYGIYRPDWGNRNSPVGDSPNDSTGSGDAVAGYRTRRPPGAHDGPGVV